MIFRNYELIVYLIMIYVFIMFYNILNSGLWNYKKVIIVMYKDLESYKKLFINIKKVFLLDLLIIFMIIINFVDWMNCDLICGWLCGI